MAARWLHLEVLRLIGLHRSNAPSGCAFLVVALFCLVLFGFCYSEY